MVKFNYFKAIEMKYLNQIGFKQPIVIRLDGIGATKSCGGDLVNESRGQFADALKQTALEVSRLYNCIVFVGVDEINLVFQNPIQVKRLFKTSSIQKIVSIVSQTASIVFNSVYEFGSGMILFDCRCFSIPNEKVASYLKYRIAACRNTAVQALCKEYIQVQLRHGASLAQLKELMDSHQVELTPYAEFGFLAQSGVEISLELRNKDLGESLRKPDSPELF